MSDQAPRGLAAVADSKQRRARFPQIPPRFWLWALTILAAWGIIYWKVTQGQLESWRGRLLARQRAVAAELGPRFIPLRDRIEGWVVLAAGTYSGDEVSEAAKTSGFQTQAGIYLRLPIADARDAESIRKAAAGSLRDGFTSCLLRPDNPNPFEGPACKHNHECPSGQHCNETFHCSPPAQPFNMRVAYRGGRVLTEEWVRDVREADSDMRMRLLERDFEASFKDDIPLAIELMTRARYFLLVLDEPPETPVNVPEDSTYAEAVQGTQHPARVFLWDIQSGKELLRLRMSAGANVGVASGNPKTVAAVRRQANNCALALDVRRALGDPGVQ